jgi:hypothetical protein
MNNIEKRKTVSVFDDPVKKELHEKGYIVLEKGTKFELELEYATPEEEFVPLKVGETRTIKPVQRDLVAYPDLRLKEDILVGRYIGLYRGEDEKNLYEFILTNERILELEKKSIEYERNLISGFNVPSEFFETAYPEGLGDIDISMYGYYHPHRAKRLQEEANNNPHRKDLVSERKALNEAFVREYLGEEVNTEELESVRIKVRL